MRQASAHACGKQAPTRSTRIYVLRDTHTSLVQVEGMLATALADMEAGYARPGSDVRPLLPVETTHT